MSRTYISRSECFEVLGIQDGASEDEIRRAYKKLALKHHPDKNNNSDESTAKFKEISTAYQKLTKPDFEDGDGDFDFTDMNEMFMQVLMSRIFGMNPFMRGGPGPVFVNPGGFGGGGFHFHDFDDDEDDYYDEDDDEDDEHNYFHDHPFFHYRPHAHYHAGDEEDDEDDEDDDDDDEGHPMNEEEARRFWQARMRAYYDDDSDDGEEYDDDEAEEDLDADDDDTVDPAKVGDERYKHTFKYNPHPMAAAIRDSEYGVFTDLLDDHPEYATANLGAGNNAMHFCARFGRVRFANYLCDHGGLQTIALRNEKEESPIEIAEAYAHKSVSAFKEIATRARKQARKEEQESKAKQQPQPKKNNKKNKKYKNTQKNSDKKKESGTTSNIASNGNNGKAAEKKVQEESDEEDDPVSFGQNAFSVLQGASKK